MQPQLFQCQFFTMQCIDYSYIVLLKISLDLRPHFLLFPGGMDMFGGGGAKTGDY